MLCKILTFFGLTQGDVKQNLFTAILQYDNFIMIAGHHQKLSYDCKKIHKLYQRFNTFIGRKKKHLFETT